MGYKSTPFFVSVLPNAEGHIYKSNPGNIDNESTEIFELLAREKLCYILEKQRKARSGHEHTAMFKMDNRKKKKMDN